MDPQTTAYGIAGIGGVCGYLLLFILKRYLPPITDTLPGIQQVSAFVVTLVYGVSTYGIGVMFTNAGGINYVGPYGIGLFAGLMINVVLTLVTEIAFHWVPRLLERLNKKK